MKKEKIGICWDKDSFDEESQQNTPARIEKFMQELENKRDFKFTVFDNEMNYDQMIILKDIKFVSFCSHHLLPFFGKAQIGYIPNGKICGISKLARVVEKFAAKPQIQENMTHEIMNYIVEKLLPAGVIVVVEAEHLCMTSRGVKSPESKMITSAISGIFQKDGNAKREFFALIKE